MQRIAAIQHKLNLPLHEVEHIIKTYRQTYPLVPVYWRNQIWKAKRHNYIENMVGRRVHFKPMAERKREDDWGYSSTAINYPIQSMGADQKYLALMVLLDLLPQWGGKFYYDLHDGLFVIVPNSKSADALPVIGHALSNLPYKRAFGVDLPIAFPVDCKIGPNWGALTEVKI